MQTSSASAVPARPVPVLPILSVHFIGTLGFSIVLPFLVFLVTRWGGNALVYGVIGATYSTFQLVGAPVLGRWSDSLGRRRVLLLSQLGTFLAWALLAVALFLPETAVLEVESGVLGTFTLTLPLLVLFGARALDGLTGGNVSVANAYMADISDDGNRSVNFGRMAMAASLGFVLGPAIAGLLGSTRFGELPPVLAALGVSGLAAAIIALRLPESDPCTAQRALTQSLRDKASGIEHKDCMAKQGEASLRTVLALPRIPLLLAIYFLVMLGFSFFYVSFPVRAATDLGWTVGGTGAFFATLSLMMVAVQGPVLSRASKRWSEPALILFGSALLIGCFLCFTSERVPIVYLGAALMALGNGLMWPSVLSVLSKLAGQRHQGAVQGYAGSLGALASILGFLTGGLLFARIGATTFALASVIVALVFVLGWRLRSVPLPS